MEIIVKNPYNISKGRSKIVFIHSSHDYLHRKSNGINKEATRTSN